MLFLMCRLGFANASDVIEVKGRVACEISRYSLRTHTHTQTHTFSLTASGDELLLTELMFNGAFNDLSVEQCVALLSCFVFQEKVSNCHNREGERGRGRGREKERREKE